jgi:hypothetical protein
MPGQINGLGLSIPYGKLYNRPQMEAADGGRVGDSLFKRCSMSSPGGLR